MSGAMRAGVCGCLFAAVAVAQAPLRERAFVAVQPSAAAVFLHEPCELVVQVGIDGDWFAAAALPLFQQQLDQPFQLLVPWVHGAEDRAVTLLPAPAAEATQRVAVGDRVVAATRRGSREIDGRRFDLLELRYRWLPLAAGVSTIAPVELRYAFATQWDDDFLRGRQPRDRQEHSVLSAPLELAVRALPQAGRPAAWTGAVGEFTVAATSAATSVPVGGTVEVELVITGDGNLDRMAPLAAPTLPGFHVQGMREPRRPAARTFVLALLALRGGVTEVPPIEFVAFSPRRGEYVVHRTAPLPLQVEPLAPGAVLPPAIAALVRADAASVAASQRWPWWSYALAAAGVGCAWAVVRGGRRRRRRRARLAHAAREVAAAVAEGPVAAVAAWERLCALCAGGEHFDRTQTFPALQAAGIAGPTLAAARELHAALDAARFGGVVPATGELERIAAALLREAR